MESCGQGLCSTILLGTGQMIMLAPSHMPLFGGIVSSGSCQLAPGLTLLRGSRVTQVMSA